MANKNKPKSTRNMKLGGNIWDAAAKHPGKTVGVKPIGGTTKVRTGTTPGGRKYWASGSGKNVNVTVEDTNRGGTYGNKGYDRKGSPAKAKVFHKTGDTDFRGGKVKKGPTSKKPERT